METTEATQAALDYAPKPPVYRRRNFRRALWILALLAIAFFAWRWGPPYARHASYVYRQRQCMNFTAPADHVAYEEDESRAAALATRAGYQSMPLRLPSATQPVMQPVAFVPPPLDRFQGGKRAAVYVGRLTSADGQERLVAVELRVGLVSSDGERRLQLMPYQATPASLLRPVTRVTRDSSLVVVSPRPSLLLVNREATLRPAGQSTFFNLARIYRLRLFWGQRDPQHPDRFAIRYIINGQPGVIEGRLDEKGNIKFTVPQGPLANRMRW